MPDFIEEEALWRRGYRYIAGIDEVGRGPLAGPVVAAAVILSADLDADWLAQVRDSKKLMPKKREFLSECIKREALAYGIGLVEAEGIDSQGILPATKTAMCLAVDNLKLRPHFLLIDALTLSEVDLPQKGIIKGDDLSLSIAAASIVAKVYRDRLMRDYDDVFGGYGFAENKGYGTTKHMEALRQQGYCPIHRRSFEPIRSMAGFSE